MRARLREIAENTPFIFKLAGEAITTELNRRCGGASVELAPVEATAILAAVLLSDHGLLTVHFAGLPPGTSALLLGPTSLGAPEAAAR
jgi:L-seryl-tRNA(Ser) seleniumtransferase